MSRKYFGTDGIRGRVGDAPVTPDFMLKLDGRRARSSPVKTVPSNGWSLVKTRGYRLHARVSIAGGIGSGGCEREAAGSTADPGIALLTRTTKSGRGYCD